MTRFRVPALVAGAALVAGSALTLLATPATAADTNLYDPSFVPSAADLVGVGSDTTQIVVHDLATAYNAGATGGRLASFAADGLPATISLRSGAAAITRPNGSGAGKKLLYGTTNDSNVTFARSSSTLSTAEKEGSLKQAAFAVDGLQMAVRSAGSNAPASLTLTQIVGIYKGTYTNWSEVGGTPGTIKALIPQSGSGTLGFFTQQLTAANGGVAFTPVASSTQEHSDVDIKSDPNAIAPFSSARATITPTVRLESGWKATRAVYNVLRNGDLAQPTTGPLLQSIFGEDGWICSPAGRTVIEAAGFDQLASTAKGGTCGEFGTEAVSNLKTATEGDSTTVTSTALTATATGSKKVTLKATVSSTGSTPVGTVEFYEGETKLAPAVFPAGGIATLNLSDVPVGPHTYVARFAPTDPTSFGPSESAARNVTVKVPASVTVTGAAAPFGKAKSALVTARVDGEPATGSVSVKVGSAAAKTFTLSAAGTVSVPIAATVPAGALKVTATLAGTNSTDAATGSVALTVAKAKATATAKAKKAKIKASQRGVVTVKVAPSGAPAAFATGKVVVKSGSKVVGRGTLKNGTVTIKLAKLKKGTYKLVASYAGNVNVSGATAKVLKLKVTR